PLGQRQPGLGGVAVAPLPRDKLPPDLELLIGRQRQQGRPADHLPGVAKLDSPAAGRRHQPRILGHPLLQQQAHGRQVTNPVHRRRKPAGYLGIAVGDQRRRGVIGIPAAQHKTPGNQPVRHGPTIATATARGGRECLCAPGVNDRTVFGETIPPANPYATRTPADPKQGTTVATIEGYVTSAEQNGGGWVQLTFHHICDSCDAYSITAANMQSLVDWLSTQVTAGAVAVETTEQVIGGTFKTPFCC